MGEFAKNMAQLGATVACRMHGFPCPHGCEAGSPNCIYNLEAGTTDSRCPYRKAVMREMLKHERSRTDAVRPVIIMKP